MEENKKDYYTKAVDKAKKWEDFFKKVIEELRTGERYQNYFSQFTPESVESFINYYAMRKVSWYRYGDSTRSWKTREGEQWYKIALQFVIAIQRKKVFQAIIKWGNYKLTVPEARSYLDFNKWLCNPFACPYVEPVQTHEIETAVRFVHSLPGEERLKYLQHEHFSIQTFMLLEIKGLELDDYDYPLFFRYWDQEYNIENQTEKLPERIKKEMAYVDVFEEHEKQLQSPQPKTEPKPQKPSLAYYKKEIVADFIMACETSEFKRMYKAKQWWTNRKSFSEAVETALNELTASPRHLPIESHNDWRDAIVWTAEMHVREMVDECLPLVYQEYTERLDKGDKFTNWVKEKDYTLNAWYPKYLQSILEGRKLKNEPADFNF